MFAATLPAILYIDKVGRKPILAGGAFVMAFCHLLIAIIFAKNVDQWATQQAAGWVAIVFVWVFAMAFGASWGKQDRLVSFMKKLMRNQDPQPGSWWPRFGLSLVDLMGKSIIQNAAIVRLTVNRIALGARFVLLSLKSTDNMSLGTGNTTEKLQLTSDIALTG